MRGVLKHMGPIDFLFKTHLGEWVDGRFLSLGPGARPRGQAPMDG